MKNTLPSLLAALLEHNTWAALGEGRFVIPEQLLADLLGQAPMPDPIDRVTLLCRPGHFVVRVRVDLHSKGVPLAPEVEQVFQLEQARIDGIGRFIVLRPQGGVQLVEASLGIKRLPPMAKVVMGRILHTPTLLALVRDRFPRQVNYEHGRLHISLAGIGALDREVKIGGASFGLLRVLTVRGMRVEMGRVVVRAEFDKAALVAALQAPAGGGADASAGVAGAEAAAGAAAAGAEAGAGEGMPAPPSGMPAPVESGAEVAIRIGRQVGGAGLRLLGRALKRG